MNYNQYKELCKRNGTTPLSEKDYFNLPFGKFSDKKGVTHVVEGKGAFTTLCGAFKGTGAPTKNVCAHCSRLLAQRMGFIKLDS